MKIGIIGLGNVGATTTYALLLSKIANEFKLFDINEKLLDGQTKDLQDCIWGINKNIKIKKSLVEDMYDCDFVVITAGKNQKPNQSRDELYEENLQIVNNLLCEINKKNKFVGKIILATNPVDRLTNELSVIHKKENIKIISTGVLLDTYRLRLFTNNENDYCSGEHGERVKINTHNNIHIKSNNIPFDFLEEKVRNRALKIIDGKGNTAFGIATAITNIIIKSESEK